MEQFTVPQFIDVEDKIFGPITVRQFIIFIVAGIILFLEFKLSDVTFFIFLAIPTVCIFGTFAFVKVNTMPFHFFLINVIQTLKKPSLRVWSRELINPNNSVNKKEEEKEDLNLIPPKFTKAKVIKSRLSDLSLIIDTGGAYKGEDKSLTFDQGN